MLVINKYPGPGKVKKVTLGRDSVTVQTTDGKDRHFTFIGEFDSDGKETKAGADYAYGVRLK